MPSTAVLGPEIISPRLTVYRLLGSFIDPDVTEGEICRTFGITPEQVAAARAYILRNPETVIEQHLKIEERIAAGTPPEVRERASRTHTMLARYKQWLAEQDAFRDRDAERAGRFPTFREWLAEQPQN